MSVKAAEIDRYQFAHARLLHGYTIDHVNSVHGHLIMRNDDKLAILAELADHVSELANIRIIKRRIHLIQNTEWCRLDQVDGKQQRCCRQCSFSPTQLRQRSRTFTLRSCYYVDACFR